MLMNTRDAYGWIARLLHWLVAALAIGMLLGGSVMAILPSGSLKSFVIGIHKSTGVIILLTMIVRLVWRANNPVPRPLGPNPLLNYVAHLLHITFYILLILQPLAGILMSQAYGYSVAVFGLFTLPPLVWQSAALGAFFGKVHTVVALMLVVTIVVHVAAALKHHFIDGDGTLMRMVKGR
ncbi:MAG: cytochrome b [Desulfosarcina sp.]